MCSPNLLIRSMASEKKTRLTTELDGVKERERELSKLQQTIDRFKTRSLAMFEVYKASNKRSSKRLALCHLVDALRHLGSAEYLGAGVYESAHKLFKEKFRRSSRRRKTVVEEVLTNDSVMGRLKTILRNEGVYSRKVFLV